MSAKYFGKMSATYHGASYWDSFYHAVGHGLVFGTGKTRNDGLSPSDGTFDNNKIRVLGSKKHS